MKQSLGFVECDGLSGALVAADRMLKTANVKVAGIRQNMGINWVTVKISGDISAVSVAVETIKETMPKVYVASTVLGSPAEGIDKLGKTDIPIFMKNEKQTPATPSQVKPVTRPEEVTDEKVRNGEEKEPAEETNDSAEAAAPTEKQDADLPANDGSDEKQDDQKVTCNLCGDPKCPRRLGEPHTKCIHYNELKK